MGKPHLVLHVRRDMLRPDGGESRLVWWIESALGSTVGLASSASVIEAARGLWWWLP